MAVTTYTVVEGQLMSQVTGGVRRDYVPDPLGSTVALLDDSNNVTDTWDYWPYGEVRVRTGSTSTPFQYVGTLGYFRDHSTQTYVRARYYKQALGRWLTVDPEWPLEPTYAYVGDSPSSKVDPTGMEGGGLICERISAIRRTRYYDKYVKSPPGTVWGITMECTEHIRGQASWYEIKERCRKPCGPSFIRVTYTTQRFRRDGCTKSCTVKIPSPVVGDLDIICGAFCGTFGYLIDPIVCGFLCVGRHFLCKNTAGDQCFVLNFTSCDDNLYPKTFRCCDGY